MWWLWIISILRDLKYLIKIALYNICGLIVFTHPLVINPDGQSYPIILIHGSSGNQSEWMECIIWLKKYFADHPVYAFSMDLPFDYSSGLQQVPYNLGVIGMKKLAHKNNWDVNEYVNAFHKYANYVYYKHDGKKLILVGHSMGGLIAHNYALRNEKFGRIFASISISSPILGAPLLENKVLKWLFNTDRHKSMTPKSKYLSSLLSHMEKTHTDIRFLTIGSEQDIHVPDAFAKFPEHMNIPHYTFDGYGHFSIVSVEYIWKLISEEIF